MFKKRYLLILIVSLLVISAIISFAIERHRLYAEQPRIYAACRDKLASSDNLFRGDWKYEYTVLFSNGGFPPPISVVFSDPPNTLWCHVHWNGSEWEVDDIGN